MPPSGTEAAELYEVSTRSASWQLDGMRALMKDVAGELAVLSDQLKKIDERFVFDAAAMQLLFDLSQSFIAQLCRSALSIAYSRALTDDEVTASKVSVYAADVAFAAARDWHIDNLPQRRNVIVLALYVFVETVYLAATTAATQGAGSWSGTWPIASDVAAHEADLRRNGRHLPRKRPRQPPRDVASVMKEFPDPTDAQVAAQVAVEPSIRSAKEAAAMASASAASADFAQHVARYGSDRTPEYLQFEAQAQKAQRTLDEAVERARQQRFLEVRERLAVAAATKRADALAEVALSACEAATLRLTGDPLPLGTKVTVTVSDVRQAIMGGVLDVVLPRTVRDLAIGALAEAIGDSRLVNERFVIWHAARCAIASYVSRASAVGVRSPLGVGVGGDPRRSPVPGSSTSRMPPSLPSSTHSVALASLASPVSARSIHSPLSPSLGVRGAGGATFRAIEASAPRPQAAQAEALRIVSKVMGTLEQGARPSVPRRGLAVPRADAGTLSRLWRRRLATVLALSGGGRGGTGAGGGVDSPSSLPLWRRKPRSAELQFVGAHMGAGVVSRGSPQLSGGQHASSPAPPPMMPTAGRR